MKEKCIPFYLENNSCNLPFYLIEDSKGNDVIYINDNNMIYTNTKNNEIGRQLMLFNKCFNQGICSIYRVSDSVSVVKQIINKEINWFVATEDNYQKIYSDYIDRLEGVNIHFNSNYLCLTLYEYGEAMPDVVAGYDLTKNKIIDCNDYNTSNKLYKSLVEIRRCRFDVIASILKGELLTTEPERLYRFLSFVLDKRVDNNNYLENMSSVKHYILKKYPELRDIDILSSIDIIKQKNKEYGINRFYFNRIDKRITDLKYVIDKIKIK